MNVLEHVGMMYNLEQSTVGAMGRILAGWVGRLDEELDELRVMVKNPNLGISHDDSEGVR
jgi:hypothetical protein